MNASVWQQYFLVLAVMFKHDKLHFDIRDQT